MKEFNLEGKVAIVTGGGRGIGKNIALCLAEGGADVVVTARTKPEIEQTAAEIRKLGRKGLAITADVGETEQVESMVATAIKQFGKVDLRVANAAIAIMKPLALLDGKPVTPLPMEAKLDTGLTDKDWSEMLNIDIFGVVRCVRAVGSHMLQRKSGKIIIMGSGEGVQGAANSSAYAVCKGGVHNFARAMALEWWPRNIQVNVVTPGAHNTEMWDRPEWHLSKEEVEKGYTKLNVQWGNMRQVGLLCVFLSSAASDYISGQVICTNTRGGVSGGRH